MPINSTTQLVTAQRALTSLDGQPSGCTRAADFAVVGDVDVTRQVHIDVANMAAGALITLAAPVGTSGSKTFFIGGATGSFTSNDGKTITVTNGIITAIV